MSVQAKTRDTILRKGAELVHAGGFSSTGLQQILTAAGVPKGSFYFYFKSKEDFGLELIDYFAAVIGGIFQRFLGDETVPPLVRLKNLLTYYESLFKKGGWRLGCPIGNLSLELSDAGGRYGERLAAAIDALVMYIQNSLDDAKRAGDLPGDFNTADAARFFFHGFEGAIMHMKVIKSIEPLRIFRKSIFLYLSAAGAKN